MGNSLLLAYAPILLFAMVAVAIVAGVLALTHLLGPKRPNRNKLTTYECGEDPIGSARGPINVQYYLYILVFLIFDVEVAFLIPWAVEYLHLGLVAAVEMAIFVGLLLVGWLYAWKRGALEWSI